MGRVDDSVPMEGVAYPQHRTSKGASLRRMQSEAQIGVNRQGPPLPSIRPRDHAQQGRPSFWSIVLDDDRPHPLVPSGSFHSALNPVGSSSSHVQPSHSFHVGAQPSAGRAPPGRQPLPKRLSCLECGESNFASQTDLNAHREKFHRRSRPFPCSLCDVGFSQKSHLNQHIRTVHQKVRPHKCTQCDKAFGKKYDLSSHRDAVHGNERPHACEFCDKRFAKRSNLTRHREKLHPDRIEPRGHR